MINQITEDILICQKCPLCKTRNKAVPGEGPITAKIMIIGEAPGHVNDECGRPFVGHGGKIFDRILENIGIDRRDLFITNVLKCWPPENRKPSKHEINSCKPYLFKQIEIIKPELIITLGGVAFETITGEKIKVKENCGKVFNINGIKVGLCIHPNALRYIKGGFDSLVNQFQECIKSLD